MRLSSVVVPLVLAGGALLVVQIVRPYWQDYVTVNQACATPAQKRTDAQRKQCQPSEPPRIIIPGIL